MFTSLLAVPIAITFLNPFPSLRPFTFPGSSQTPAPTATPAPSVSPTQNPASTPAPTVNSEVEIEDVDPSSANFMQEFTLTGFNFGANPGSVSFRYYTQNYVTAAAPVVTWSNNEIKAKVPAVKKGYYRIQVITENGKKSGEVKFTVKNGQPVINSTSVSVINGVYEFTFQGLEFGSSRGGINIYSGQSLAGKGVIKYWSSSKVRFGLPALPNGEYGFQIQTSDGRLSSLKYFTAGN